MIYLLYFNKLEIPQRQVAFLGLGAFLILETLILVGLTGYNFLGYFLSALGISILFIALLQYPAPSRNQITSILYRDLVPLLLDGLLYMAILIGTFVVNVARSSYIPPGKYFSRLDTELFLLAVIIVLMAIIAPVFRDLWISKRMEAHDRFRELEFLKFIPFGYQRTIRAALIFPLLGCLTVPFFQHSPSLQVSIWITLVYAILSIMSFQLVYGYRSWIISGYGGTLFLTTCSAYYLSTWGSLRLSDTLIVFINGVIYIWLALIPVAFSLLLMTGLQTGGDPTHFAPRPKQKPAHFLYLGILVGGHVVIYAFWISPFLRE